IGTIDTMDVQKGLVVVGEQSSGSGGCVRNVSIAGNVAQGFQGQGIVVGGGTISCVENVAIANNVLDGRYPGRAWVNSPALGNGILVGIATKNFTVSGNIIRYVPASVIYVAGSISTTATKQG